MPARLMDKRRRKWIGMDAGFYSSRVAADLYGEFGVAGVALYDAALRACAISDVPGYVFARPPAFTSLVGLPGLEIDIEAWLKALSNKKLIRRCVVDGYAAIRFNKWDEGTRAQTQRPALPSSIRRLVLERDENRCQQCGATERLSIDHIYPYSLGGSDDLSNLRVLCSPCNSSKGARV